MFHLLLYLLILLRSVDSYTERISYNMEVQYVPLGQNAIIECDAVKQLKRLNANAKISVSFNLIAWDSNGQKWEKIPNSEGRFIHKNDSNNIIYALALQKINNGTHIECLAKFDQIYKTTLDTTTIIVIQDCGEKDELLSMNKLNPCRFGRCSVKKDTKTMIEETECNCIEQYTGRFCNVPVEGVAMRELFYYSPVIALFTFILLTVLCYPIINSVNSNRLLLLEKHVPSTDRGINLRILYPSSYVNPDEFEDLFTAESIKEGNTAASMMKK